MSLLLKNLRLVGYVIPETKTIIEVIFKGKLPLFSPHNSPRYICERHEETITARFFNVEGGKTQITLDMLQQERKKNENVLNKIIYDILPEECLSYLNDDQKRALCIMTLVDAARDSIYVNRGHISRYLLILILLIANCDSKLDAEKTIDVDNLTIKYINVEMKIECLCGENKTFQIKLPSSDAGIISRLK